LSWRRSRGYRFQTHPDLAPYVERFANREVSTAVDGRPRDPRHRGYRQPVSRSQICACAGECGRRGAPLDQRGYIEAVAAPRAGQRSSTDDRTVLGAPRLDRLDQLPPVEDFLPARHPGDLEMGLRGVPVSRRRRLSGPDGTSRPRQRRDARTRDCKRCSPRRLRQPSSLRRPDRRRTGDRRREIAVLASASTPKWRSSPSTGPRGKRARPRPLRTEQAAAWSPPLGPQVAHVLELVPPSPVFAVADGPRHRGLLLLTNDGDWPRLSPTLPRVDKEYLAEVEASPARCTPGAPPGRGARRRAHRTRHGGCGLTGVLRIVIHEGRNRQSAACARRSATRARLVRTASGRSRTGRCGQGSSGSSPRPRCARSGSPRRWGSSRRGGPSAPRRPAVAFPLDAPQASVRACAVRRRWTRIRPPRSPSASRNSCVPDERQRPLGGRRHQHPVHPPRRDSTSPPPGTGDRLRRGPAPVRAEIAVPVRRPVLAGPAPCRDHPRPDELRHVYSTRQARDDSPAEPGPHGARRLPPTWPVRAAPRTGGGTG